MLGKTTAQTDRNYVPNFLKIALSVVALMLGLSLASSGADASSSTTRKLSGQNHATTPALVTVNDASHLLQPGSTPGNCPAPSNGGTTTVGCRFVLDLMLNAGSNAYPDGISAAQSYLTYTYQLIQNASVSSIGTSCVLTSTVTADRIVYDAILQDEVCNGPDSCTFRGVTVGPGSFAYASGAFENGHCGDSPDYFGGCPNASQPPPWNQQIVRIAQVGICATASGQATLHWQFLPSSNRDSEILNVDGFIVSDPSLYTDYTFTILDPTSTPTATPTFAPTRTPAGNAYNNLQPGASTSGNCPAPANGATTTVGCRFVLDMMIDAGSSVAPNGIDGYQGYLTFTNQFVQVARVSSISTSCVPTNTITGDLAVFDRIFQNEVCNGPNPCVFRSISVGPGSVGFVDGSLDNCVQGCPDPSQPPPFNQPVFRAAQVGICATAAGQARFHWQFSPPAPVTRDTEMVTPNGDLVNDPLLYSDYTFNIVDPTNTPTITYTPTATPTAPAYHAIAPSHTSGNCPAPTNGSTTTVGCRFVLDLMVNAGGNVSPNGTTAEQSYLTYTYQLVQVARVTSIATSCIPTTTITADNSVFDATMQNEVCNGPNPCTFRGVTVGPGSLAHASAALNNCPGGCPDPNSPPPQNQQIFRVAQIGICAIAPGQAIFHWQFSPPAPSTRDTEIATAYGYIANDPSLYTDYIFNIVAPTDTPTPTSTPGMRGHGTWEGRQPQPDVSQVLPISLTLRMTTGGPYYDYPLQNTDASGNFTVSVAGLPNGTYNWRAKGPQYLANSGTFTLSGNPITSVEMGLMRVGDANGDNVVNINDFNVTKGTFGESCGQGGYDGRADFTGDCVVNVQDCNLLKKNFGSSGAPPISPRGP